MTGPIDLSTTELKTILKWGDKDYIFTKERVDALIEEILRERERANEAERQIMLIKSELEMAKAKVKPMAAYAPKKPEYKDGVRQANPPQTTTGADGFQSPIISQ